tara:strand:- start:92 stop:514 length:423 start_codon:yes stop_codon:yes gene_type:complete
MTQALGLCFDLDLMQGDMAEATKTETPVDFLNSAILASLFTNRRDPAQQLGGCWSDALYNDSFGSLLWTKTREKLNQDLLTELDQICRDSLKWLAVEGHIKAVDVAVERASAHGVLITITLHLNNDDTLSETIPYELESA